MDLTLIPFGLRPSDGELVDVFDVTRGRSAGCICPSCQTPLVARQGVVKRWHFSHHTRGTFASTASRCQYSLFVSLRLMAHQLVGKEIDLALPECVGKFSPSQGTPTSDRSFVVSPPQAVRVSEIGIEERLLGTTADLVGKVDGVDFVVYLEHPGRAVPAALDPQVLAGTRAGVIAIDLRVFANRMEVIAKERRGYKPALLDFIRGDTGSKRWIYHPRFAAAKRHAESRSSEPLPQAVILTPTPVRHLGTFQCAICGRTWQAPVSELPDCPMCGAHLCSRLISP